MPGQPNDPSMFACTNARSTRRVFGIRQSDRLSHLYLIGKTGTGKTTLLETLIAQDLAAGRGFALIDPHGDLAERVSQRITPKDQDRVLCFDATAAVPAFGYNPLLPVSAAWRPLVASGLMDVFKKMWADAWGVRMEHILRNTLLALLEQPRASLPDILLMINNKAFRTHALRQVENVQVRAFWRDEFPKYSLRYQADGIAPIQNKVGAFLADPKLRAILVPKDGGLRLRSLMDAGQGLVVNLSQGRMGADSSGLLGGLLVTALGSAAFSRAATPERQRLPFFVYVDEFQSFTTLALANMLSELRKYGVGMVLAHQYLQQLDPAIQHAVLGNAGTLIAFRLGAFDAALIAREFEPVFAPVDLMTVPNYEIRLKLMIDGTPSRPFSAQTLRPSELGMAERRGEAVD